MTSQCCFLRVWMPWPLFEVCKVLHLQNCEHMHAVTLRDESRLRVWHHHVTHRIQLRHNCVTWHPTNKVELAKLMRRCHNKTCIGLTTCLLIFWNGPSAIQLRALVQIVNASPALGRFPDSLKAAVLRPLLTDSSLDRNNIEQLQTCVKFALHLESAGKSCYETTCWTFGLKYIIFIKSFSLRTSIITGLQLH